MNEQSSIGTRETREGKAQDAQQRGAQTEVFTIGESQGEALAKFKIVKLDRRYVEGSEVPPPFPESALDPRMINGFYGYAICRDGMLIGCRKFGPRSCKVRFYPRWRILKPRTNDTGYLIFTLRGFDGGRRDRSIHTLVIEHFTGPRPDKKQQARHFDGNKLNNNSSNLLWGTALENAADARRHRANKL